MVIYIEDATLALQADNLVVAGVIVAKYVGKWIQ
jgi:hypothetical protein